MKIIKKLTNFIKRIFRKKQKLDKKPKTVQKLKKMEISKEGLEFIAYFEGWREKAYKDVAGHLTIGYGHLITPEEKKTGNIYINKKQIRWVKSITKAQGLQILLNDSRFAEKAVNDLVSVGLHQRQFNALCSFTFNLGSGNLKRSTLLKKVNAGEFDQVPKEFKKWVNAGGKRVRGLVIRRNKEAEMFKNPPGLKVIDSI